MGGSSSSRLSRGVTRHLSLSGRNQRYCVIFPRPCQPKHVNRRSAATLPAGSVFSDASSLRIGVLRGHIERVQRDGLRLAPLALHLQPAAAAFNCLGAGWAGPQGPPSVWTHGRQYDQPQNGHWRTLLGMLSVELRRSEATNPDHIMDFVITAVSLVWGRPGNATRTAEPVPDSKATGCGVAFSVVVFTPP
jgi:hypothetical protein